MKKINKNEVNAGWPAYYDPAPSLTIAIQIMSKAIVVVVRIDSAATALETARPEGIKIKLNLISFDRPIGIGENGDGGNGQ